ncbi:MAG: FMN-binding protein [Lachnospiraceae bacterium]|nr:FMN-binding protein [Lachnospiraceae bacterium]
MKKLLKILLVIGILFAALLTAVVVTVGIRMGSQVKAFDRTGIDVSHVPDGVYTGHSETDLVKVEVKVSVSDGMIRDIEILKHECGKGLPANEIVKDMVRKNDVEVDAVSGATVSSEVIKDAVRNALRGA